MLTNGEYVPLTHTNAITAVNPAQNRLRRVERCEMSCGSVLEIHCLRFDIQLGCAAYLDYPVIQHHIVTAQKMYAYMIRSEYIKFIISPPHITYHHS